MKDGQMQNGQPILSPGRDLRSVRLGADLRPGGDLANLSQLIDKIGFGSYQIQVLLLCSAFMIMENSQLTLATSVTAHLATDFGIMDRWGVAMLNVAIFIGFAIGTITSGPVSDMLGRRYPIIFASAGIVVVAFGTYFVMSKVLVYMLRFAMGFFCGFGIPSAMISITETSPIELRAVLTAALGVSYQLGDAWAALGLRLFSPYLHNSRVCYIWCMAPLVPLILINLLSPVARYDTPYFLAGKGKQKELSHVIHMMARLNGRSHVVPAGDGEFNFSDTEKAPEAISFGRALPLLAKWPLILHTIILSLFSFGKDWAYFGTGMFWPLAWTSVTIGHMCPATELLLTALGGIPGVFVSMCLMYMMPRRFIVALGALLCAVSAPMLQQLEPTRIGFGHKLTVGWIGVAIFKLFFPTWQMVSMLLPSEVFPTQIRSAGFGVVAIWGRLAPIVAPFIISTSHTLFLLIMGLLGLSVALTACLLPETKGRELTDLSSDTPREGEEAPFSPKTTARRRAEANIRNKVEEDKSDNHPRRRWGGSDRDGSVEGSKKLPSKAAQNKNGYFPSPRSPPGGTRLPSAGLGPISSRDPESEPEP